MAASFEYWEKEKWSRAPALWRLLKGKRLPKEELGYPSTPDFTQFRWTLEIALLACESESDIVSATTSGEEVDVRHVAEDLTTICGELSGEISFMKQTLRRWSAFAMPCYAHMISDTKKSKRRLFLDGLIIAQYFLKILAET